MYSPKQPNGYRRNDEGIAVEQCRGFRRHIPGEVLQQQLLLFGKCLRLSRHFSVSRQRDEVTGRRPFSHHEDCDLVGVVGGGRNKCVRMRKRRRCVETCGDVSLSSSYVVDIDRDASPALCGQPAVNFAPEIRDCKYVRNSIYRPV